jgi:hypothetical protein
MYYCKRKMYSVVNLYFDDVVVDIITIRGNRNFHLRFFVKSGSLHQQCDQRQQYHNWYTLAFPFDCIA